MLNNVNSLA